MLVNQLGYCYGMANVDQIRLQALLIFQVPEATYKTIHALDLTNLAK